jgi:hypothetical protein
MPRLERRLGLGSLALAGVLQIGSPTVAQDKTVSGPPADEEPESGIIEVDERSAEAMRRRVAQQEFESIDAILRDPAQIERVARPGRTVSQARAALEARHKELREMLARQPTEPLFRRRDTSAMPAGRTASLARQMVRAMMEEGPGPQWSTLPQLLPSEPAGRPLGGGGCNLFWIGVVRASSFREYRWSTGGNGRGRIVFWPLWNTAEVPSSTQTTGWTNDIGSNFWGKFDEPPGPIFDLTGWVRSAGVLRFRFPPPPCEVTLCWGTWARADRGLPWTFAADYGRISTEWWVHEAPNGSGFPGSSSYSVEVSGLYASTYGGTVSRDRIPMEGCFTVRAGVAARVYLGASLEVVARDGHVSTIDTVGVGDHFLFENGVTFVMGAGE